MQSEGAEVSTLIGSLMKNQIEDQVRKIQRVRNREYTSDLTDSLMVMEQIAGKIWAQSTMRSRQCLWDRLLIWVERNDVPVNQDTVALFVTATKVSKQGMLAYAKAFSGMLKRMGLENETLKQLAAALRADGAAVPLEQAEPINRSVLIAWAMKQDVQLKTGLLIAWKSAARWGEVWKLGRRNFVFISVEEIIVDWWDVPKGRREDPFKPSRWVVIKGFLTPEIAHKGFNKGIGCVVEKGCSNGKIFGAFNKEGRDFSYHGYHVNWKKGRRGGDGKATKAFIEERSVLRGDDPVWRRSDVYGSSVKDGRDNSIVVRKHNICRRPKRSVLPRSLEEKNSPLHVTKIEPMLISFVKERMSQKRLKRFEFVWDLTFFPHKVCHNTRSTDSLVSHAPTLDFHTELDHVLNFSKTVRPESSFSRTHADLLVENGIAQKTSKPGLVENVPFTVIEQKATGLRQRFILWTKQSNERLVDDGYIADVPLGHISEYLDSVLFDCASGRDFRTGFYQVEIPHDARKLFGFRSDDGQYFELTRLPMR